MSCFVWPTVKNLKIFSLRWYKTEKPKMIWDTGETVTITSQIRFCRSSNQLTVSALSRFLVALSKMLNENKTSLPDWRQPSGTHLCSDEVLWLAGQGIHLLLTYQHTGPTTVCLRPNQSTEDTMAHILNTTLSHLDKKGSCVKLLFYSVVLLHHRERPDGEHHCLVRKRHRTEPQGSAKSGLFGWTYNRLCFTLPIYLIDWLTDWV